MCVLPPLSRPRHTHTLIPSLFKNVGVYVTCKHDFNPENEDTDLRLRKGQAVKVNHPLSTRLLCLFTALTLQLTFSSTTNQILEVNGPHWFRGELDGRVRARTIAPHRYLHDHVPKALR
jgi:hypothetical protein